jgi:hypothetical protein
MEPPQALMRFDMNALQTVLKKVGNVLWPGPTVPSRPSDVVRHDRANHQDFQRQSNLRDESDRPAAVAEAKVYVMPGRRMFCWDIDTGDWSQISHSDTSLCRHDRCSIFSTT